jgi:hypothetical protein
MFLLLIRDDIFLLSQGRDTPNPKIIFFSVSSTFLGLRHEIEGFLVRVQMGEP